MGSGASAIFVPGLARKFCTITSCRWPWRSCRSRSASSASTRSRRVSPMPIRMPLVYGIARRPARSIASRRTSGSLSGEPKCGLAALRQPRARGLEHDPLRGADLAQREQLVVVEDARVGVRQQARLAQHEARAVRQVGRGRGEAEPVELLARRPVAQLGLVAEREQRLVAARQPPRLGDREHLVLAHVAALAAPRRARERAVVADVAAEVRERDEDLRRERHERPGRARARALAQLGQRRAALGVGERLVGRQAGGQCRRHAATRSRQAHSCSSCADVVVGRRERHDQVRHARLVVAVGERRLVSSSSTVRSISAGSRPISAQCSSRIAFLCAISAGVP